MTTLGDVSGMQLQTVALQYDNAIVQVSIDVCIYVLSTRNM